MAYTDKIRETINNLTEEEAKRYLGDIVVNYALRGEPLTAEEDYIKPIQTVLKIVSADVLRKNSNTEIKLKTPKFNI